MKQHRRSGIVLAIAALTACSSQPKPPDVQNVPLPTGETVKVVGEGPAPAPSGMRKLGLRYVSGVDPSDPRAVHDEALRVWHFFRLQAEGQNYRAAVLTPQNRGRSSNFTFARINGRWYEVDAGGHPAAGSPQRLTGEMRPLSWMLGTWTCDMTFHGATAQRRAVIIISDAAAGGSAVDETYAASWGPGAALGETTVGYNPQRKVWYRRGRQVPNGSESDETSGAYSNDVTFAGYAQVPDRRSVPIRKRFVVNAAGNAMQLATQARIGGAWRTMVTGGCKKRAG